jgi:hypothetical protein
VCVAVGSCSSGYHDGGDGSCVLAGTCSVRGLVVDGTGRCVWGTKESSGTSTAVTLSAVWGSSASDVYVVGTGVVLHSTGNGIWVAQVSGTMPNFQAVWGSSATDVYVGGTNGTILHSTGNGAWVSQTTGTILAFSSIWGSSATDIFASANDTMGTPTIFYSPGDGTWTPVWTGSMSKNSLWSVWGTAHDNVYVVGSGGATPMVHYDGSQYTTQTTGAGQLYHVWGSSVNDVYAVGQNATILHSPGNLTWTAQGGLPTAFFLQGVWGSSASDVFVVGVQIGSPYGAVVCHSTGNGVWTSLPVSANGPSDGLVGVWGSSASDVYAVGWGGVILHSRMAL